jgi:hypothetical protein
MELAALRGMDSSPFLQARQHVEDNDYGFTWSSAWKNSPGRKFRACCRYELLENGFGELVVEVRGNDNATEAATSPQLAWVSFEGFKRSTKSFYWLNGLSFSVRPYIGIPPLIGEEFMVGLKVDPNGQIHLDEGRMGPPPAVRDI